jgi:DNA polymerase-3 subunit chi
MTNVIMYIGVSDKLRFLLGLLSKKLLPHNMRVLIAAADEAEVAKVDNYLWTAVPGGFVPHVRLEDDAATETPVLITAGTLADDFHADTLVSWQHETPSFFPRFACLIDIVPTEGKDSGRTRYRFYQSHGYQINVHNLDK